VVVRERERAREEVREGEKEGGEAKVRGEGIRAFSSISGVRALSDAWMPARGR